MTSAMTRERSNAASLESCEITAESSGGRLPLDRFAEQ